MTYKFSVWEVYDERRRRVGVYTTKEYAEKALLDLQAQKELDYGAFCGINEIKVNGGKTDGI
ncbi:hypothetical protein [Macrococcus capreoli]|uniref:hypothetical protein n=1 Tax=Macrococcus capreoli TaxID=2982690 RepID=UPI0021D5EAAD|nr:hypothetical protein [Macrococcus sp. TMW 2.2395]MCU7556578.1 hypothetical protein [Macrococcus sp. TMW 2.2395]